MCSLQIITLYIIPMSPNKYGRDFNSSKKISMLYTLKSTFDTLTENQCGNNEFYYIYNSTIFRVDKVTVGLGLSDQIKLTKHQLLTMNCMIFFLCPYQSIYYLYIIFYIYYIILYIIKVELRRRDCAKWFHQIAKILLDFQILKELN